MNCLMKESDDDDEWMDGWMDGCIIRDNRRFCIVIYFVVRVIMLFNKQAGRIHNTVTVDV